MTNDLTLYDLLKQLFSKDELAGTSGVVVIQDGDGYVLFNEYHLIQEGNQYKLTKFNTHLDNKFYSLRNAVIWATLDKRQRVTDSLQVLNLDRILEGTTANFALHKHLLDTTKNVENKGLYFTKLQEDKIKKKSILKQLNSYAQEVKKWQFQQLAAATK
jgi:hypothetical protein